ncbi:MAG: DUF4843 domain-containing protein [Butyricimonas faecihominis]
MPDQVVCGGFFVGIVEDGKVVSAFRWDLHFDEMVFHKGMNVDSVFVVLKKTAQLEDAYCRVVLQIEPSEFFEVGETVYSQAKIYFTSAISIPGWWDETVNKYYLGGFTPKKYEIFCREVGVTDLTGVEENIYGYALKFKRYLGSSGIRMMELE